MNESLPQVLSELERFGAENDGTIVDRPHRMLNITRDTVGNVVFERALQMRADSAESAV